MNTKQVEELTGIARQNIRYYERQGLLEPVRETENSYRDYSEEDIRRLKLIKMLRMLDMPLKEIERILNDEVPLKEAIETQQKHLQSQQEQLKAALDICTHIRRDKSEVINVDAYLTQMEHIQQSGGIFAQIVNDYKQVAEEERNRKFTFLTDEPVHTPKEFEQVLKQYAKDQNKKYRLVKAGMYPEFTLDGIAYTAARIIQGKNGTTGTPVQIICSRVEKGYLNAERKREITGRRRVVLQGIHTIGGNIRRHRGKSILNTVISLMCVLVLSFYLGNLSATKQQLEELPDKIPIRATVMNANGELQRTLFIRQDIVDTVYDSEYTEEIQETGEFIGTTGDEFQILGISIPECLNDFTKDEIQWAEGWNWSKFLDGENVCIADEEFLKERKLKIGDTLETGLSYYTRPTLGFDLYRQDLTGEAFQIVGTGKFEQSEDENLYLPSVVLPLKEVKQVYEDNGVVYWASSLAFKVKNPMQLNALKQELKEIHVQQVVPAGADDNAGAALLIEDEIFTRTVTSLNKNLLLLEAFFPFLLLVTVLAGYIVPHLLFQGRRREYAVMRALGTGRIHCTILFFVEHIVLAMIGATAGVLIGMICGAVGVSTALFVWGLFLICYLLGAAAAMWAFGRISVAAVLASRD